MTAVRSHSADTVVISEVFGPTIQGEGPAAGRRASFIRLGGCNLACSWCDTPYSWDGKRYDLRTELSRCSVPAVAAEVASHGTGLAVITGGEPLLQQGHGLETLAATLAASGTEVHAETNGTLRPGLALAERITLFAVSPKLPHAGQGSKATEPAVLEAFAALARKGRAYLKVVCQNAADVTAAAAIARTYGWPRRSCWVMPEGTSSRELLACQRRITGPAIDAGLNVTTRMHILIWGSERGR